MRLNSMANPPQLEDEMNSLVVQSLDKMGSLLFDVARKPRTHNAPAHTARLVQRMEPLSALAVIAIFLAGVQAQSISFSLAQTSTKLEITTNVFAFAGLFLDVLGGSCALVGFIQLQHTQTLLKERQLALNGLRDTLRLVSPEEQRDNPRQLALLHHFHLLDKIILAPIHYPKLWMTMGGPLLDSARIIERILKTFDDSVQISAAYSLADYRVATDALMASAGRTSLGLAASAAVPAIVIAGLFCFTCGALCLAIASQPAAVWGTCVAVLAITFVLLGVVFVAKHSGILLRGSRKESY
ncbi:hypothetical protein MIND_00773300 [Mycena indigotica]|uniref:Transmembrane protein n=1 Tax=Mycena indigotica TaxID=2126181 RepID=A0A8H6SNV9_9AGAR|nr:uncharacterized protein MIND_00773300 [Mycena indigotica]KAF7302066.1 hypothetical protein MIND_00773300 [Mycena indigotica]